MHQIEREGKLQRFCQRCGRCHELHAFDKDRRSCRAQLAKHNARFEPRSSPVVLHLFVTALLSDCILPARLLHAPHNSLEDLAYSAQRHCTTSSICHLLRTSLQDMCFEVMHAWVISGQSCASCAQHAAQQ